MLKIDYTDLVAQLPDVLRRQVIRLDWLLLQLTGLDNLYQRLVAINSENIFVASHNYQTLSIESAINKKFVLSSPAYIIDGVWLELNYATLINEKYISIEYLEIDADGSEFFAYTDVEMMEDSIDFYIVISISDSDKEVEIESLVKLLVQGGKNFKIINA